MQTQNNIKLHIFISIFVLAASFFFMQPSVSQVKAQGGACGTRCGIGYPGCGPAPSGYSIKCQQGATTTTGTCVCTPSAIDTNVTLTPTPTKAPLPTISVTPDCLAKCDLNGDGAVTIEDVTPATASIDPATEELYRYCRNVCILGATTTPAPSGVVSVSPGSGVDGDCSGPTPGTPDGKVDLLDVEYFRRELNREVSTLSCDFDNSGVTDIIDFTHHIRGGFVKN